MLRKLERVVNRQFGLSTGLLCFQNQVVLPTSVFVTQLSNKEYQLIKDCLIKEVITLDYFRRSQNSENDTVIGPFFEFDEEIEKLYRKAKEIIQVLEQLDKEEQYLMPVMRKRKSKKLNGNQEDKIPINERTDQIFSENMMTSQAILPNQFLKEEQDRILSTFTFNMKNLLKDHNPIYGSLTQLNNITIERGSFGKEVSFLEGKYSVQITELLELNSKSVESYLSIRKSHKKGIKALEEFQKKKQSFMELLNNNGWMLVRYKSVGKLSHLIKKLTSRSYRRFVNNLIECNLLIGDLAKNFAFFPATMMTPVTIRSPRNVVLNSWTSMLNTLMAKKVLHKNVQQLLLREENMAIQSEIVVRIFREFSVKYRVESKALEEYIPITNLTQEELNTIMRKCLNFKQINRKKDSLEENVRHLLSRVGNSEASKAIEEELERYLIGKGQMMNNVFESWLRIVVKLPFGIVSTTQPDILITERIMNESHYGMEKVKQRILEVLSSWTLSGQFSKGRVFCLVGPPGVGKTSIVKAIAESLGRKFIRIALGGEGKSSILKGHLRFYVSSAPGKIVNAIISAGTMNPVILLDEVDKISFNTEGLRDVLLEILDSNQNHRFVDKYLNFPLDLSQVLFICSANSLINRSIPPALLDRFEILELPGYTTLEKIQILKKCILPKLMKSTGLDRYNIDISFTKNST